MSKFINMLNLEWALIIVRMQNTVNILSYIIQQVYENCVIRIHKAMIGKTRLAVSLLFSLVLIF